MGLFSFRGRIPRTDYWVVVVGLSLLNGLLGIATAVVRADFERSNNASLILGAGLVVLLMVLVFLFGWIGLANYTRRLHDTGRSAWWLLILLVPGLGGIVLLFGCGLARGQVGSNRYGPDPLDSGEASAVAGLLNMSRGEVPLALLAVVFNFCVLCGYYFLRPVRDAMGVSRGMDDLRWLFALTSVVSLLLVLAFGGVVAKTDRRRFIPVAYGFVIACLFLFAGLLVMDGRSGGGLIGTDTETLLARVVGYTYFVWLSAINLFVTSLFWAFMVDLFNVDQGKRMFAFIGIGGTLGALVGGSVTVWISNLTDSVYLPASLMLIGAALFGAAIVCMLTLDRMAIASEHSRHSVEGTVAATDQASASPAPRIGGTFWDGVREVATSPYILGIGVWIVFMAVANTLIYFTQANIILTSTDTFSQRVAGFGLFDALTQVATLLTQMFVTTHVIKKMGVGWTLAILPIVTMAGFAILSVWTVFGVMAIFQAIHRATRYSMSRPARETLYSVLTPSEKYKAKPIVDVFLYRGGDLAGVGVDSLFAALGLTLGWVAAATVPLAAVWTLLSSALGRAQQRKVADAPSAGAAAGVVG